MRHLVNVNDVRRIEAAISMPQILFDKHQFIYAEVLVESQLLDQHSLLAVPKEAQMGLKDRPEEIYSTLRFPKICEP